MEWLKMVVDFGVIWLLALLSVIAVACAIERLLVYRKIRPADFAEKRELELELTRKLHVIATRRPTAVAFRARARPTMIFPVSMNPSFPMV